MTPRFLSSALALALALALTACDSPERDAKTAREAVAAYRANPDDPSELAASTALDRLDSRVAQLEKSGDSVRFQIFAAQAKRLRDDFNAAKQARSLRDTLKAVQGIGDAIIEAGRAVGDAMRSSGNQSE